MFDRNRRQFITLLGGAAAWPVAARAQQPVVPIVGFLRNTPSAAFEHIVAALRRGLAETGFVEGRNVIIEQRWAEGRDERLPALSERSPLRLPRPPCRSCSRLAAIPSATASSPVSTFRAPTSPA
jgi:putative ABC transport system substrate-binding protein